MTVLNDSQFSAPPFVQVAIHGDTVVALDGEGVVWIRIAYQDGSGTPWVPLGDAASDRR